MRDFVDFSFGLIRRRLFQQHEASTVSEDNHQIHQHQHQIVMPALAAFAPEAAVPHEYFFLDGTEHNEDEAKRRELSKNSQADSQATQQLGRAKKESEALAHADVLAARFGIF